MKIYVAGITGEQQYRNSIRSFDALLTRPGDYVNDKPSGRGDVARRLVCDEFMSGDWDAIAMIDMDMLHPSDMIEALRTHDLDMVTGHYYARNSRNIHSVCWGVGNGKWPYPPLVNIPRTGMHEIAVTGMGNVLIKRQVVQDVWDYLPKGDHPFAIGPAPEITGDHSSLGTDFRFFSLARMLGYKLWLDADINSRHGVVFWIDHDTADRMYNPRKTAERLDAIASQVKEVEGMEAKYLELRIEKLNAQLKDLQEQKANYEKGLDFINRQIQSVVAVISEDKFLLKEMQDKFPVADPEEKAMMETHRKELPDVSEAEAKEARGSHLNQEAREFVDDLQTIRGSGQLP